MKIIVPSNILGKRKIGKAQKEILIQVEASQLKVFLRKRRLINGINTNATNKKSLFNYVRYSQPHENYCKDNRCKLSKKFSKCPNKRWKYKGVKLFYKKQLVIMINYKVVMM